MKAWPLPERWRWATLDDVAAKIPNAIVDGPFGSNLKTSDYVAEGVPVLQGKNITGDKFRWFDVRFVAEAKAESLKRSYVRLGDILMVKIGSIGYAAPLDHLDGHPRAIIPANMAKISAAPDVIDTRYLCQWLTSLPCKRELLARASKTAQPALSLKKIKTLPIPLPPLPEQKRIAAILDKADAIRRKRQESIRLLDDFLRATFLDMFGDPVTNPKGWPVAKLADVGTLDRGVSKHRPRNAPELLGGPYPLVQTGEVANSGGYIRQHTQTYSERGLKQSRIWPAGTLCITIAANIAKTGILTFDACFPDSVVGFTPDSDATTTEFIQHWLSFLQKILEETAPESAQKNINLKILRGLDAAMPPLSLQQQFTSIVESTERQKASLHTHQAELDTLSASLQQRAFKGEL